MSYIYSNDGQTFRWRDPSEDYQLQPGDVDLGLEVATTEQLQNAFPAYIAKVPVPDVVTMRQARIALLRAGLLSQVDAAIAAMPAETGGDEARITWAYGAEVRRDGPLIGQLAPGLGLTDEQIDSLFIEAATL